MAKTDQVNITDALKELAKIVGWFDDQSEVDVEEGLKKVRRAAELIKASKGRLAQIDNDFREIAKEIRNEIGEVPQTTTKKGVVKDKETDYPKDDIDPDGIPF